MLKRFIDISGMMRRMGVYLCGLFLLVLVPVASATYPTVVASSSAPLATGFNGYINKLVVDPVGNIFVTDSSNGRLWEIPVGTNAPMQIFLQNTAATAGTTVTAVKITNPGSGYTSAPTVTFSGGGAGVTTPAVGTAYISSAGTVTLVQMTNVGAGYSAAPTVTFSAPPSGGTPATGVATILPVLGLSSVHGFAVDKYGDVIVSSGTNGNLYFLPNKNGTVSTLSNATGTAPLDLTGSNGFSTLDDYYVVISDVAIDGSGNLYVAVSHCNNSGSNACGTSEDSILLIKGITNTTTSATIAAANQTSVFVGALPGGKAALNMAVDNNGHLFYVDGTNAYVVSTTSGANPTPTVLGSGFTAPSGISVDASGNVYIVDNSKKLLYEIPNENGTLNPSDQFVVAPMTNPYYSIGFDTAGNVLQADGTDKTVQKVTLGALSAGTAAVGGAAITGVLNFRFNTVGTATVTPTAISLLQGTGASTEFLSTTATTCAANTAYANGTGCQVTVSFKPSSTGLRRGGIVLQGAGNKALGTGYLYGTGSGAALTADPGTQTALTGASAWVTPGAIALDAVGNSYVADSGSNTVQVISAGGTAIASIGSGLNKPQGVTVDSAGNVFISDTGNNRIVEVPNEAGTLNTSDQITVLPSLSGLPGTPGLNKPLGIYAGSDGGLYVADSGNARVLRYSTFDGLGSLTQTTVGSTYKQPVAVTTDGNGNVYVADAIANQIDEINLVSGVQTVALANLSTPTAISVDGSGALYVVTTGDSSATRYSSVGGAVQVSSGLLLGTGLSTPAGIAVNGAGNVAVTDDGAPAVGTSGQPGYVPAILPTAFSLVRTGGTVYFGNVNMGLSSSQNVTLTSIGSATATLGTPAYVATGSTANYTVTNGSCANGVSLTVGASCTYLTTLAPVVGSGALTELLSFSSNAVNTSSVTETLTGVATNLSLTTTVLALTSSPNPVYGQTVTVTATVTSQRAGVNPTGFVTFSLDGTNAKPNKLLPANCSPTGTVCTVSYTFTTLLAVGTHAVNARYLGDTLNAGSNATAAVTLTVTKQPTTTLDVASTVSNVGVTNFSAVPVIPLLPGSSFYFLASAFPTIAGTPTGTFSLVAAGTTGPVLATGTLSATGTATLSYVPPATPGSYSYQLIYSGDSNFAGSTSGAVTVQISTPVYTVTVPSSSYTVTDGGNVTIPITVTGIAGYAGNVTLGQVNTSTNAITAPCVGLPQYVTCTFSPGIVALTNGNYPVTNAVQSINLTIATSVPPPAPYGGAGFVTWTGGIAAMLTMLLALRRRKSLLGGRLLGVALVALAGGILAGLSGCTSGRGSSPAYVSPKGAATITVNFSGSPAAGYPATGPNVNIPNSTSFQLTVQ